MTASSKLQINFFCHNHQHYAHTNEVAEILHDFLILG
jgi:hypothetical protein